MFSNRIFAEIKTFHKRFRLKKSDRNYKHQIFYYEDGKIYRAYKKGKKIEKEEYIYIHFRRKIPANKQIEFQKAISKEKLFPLQVELSQYYYNRNANHNLV